jgi:hypothetical protein
MELVDHYRDREIPPLIFIFGQINPVDTLPRYSLKINFVIILSSASGASFLRNLIIWSQRLTSVLCAMLRSLKSPLVQGRHQCDQVQAEISQHRSLIARQNTVWILVAHSKVCRIAQFVIPQYWMWTGSSANNINTCLPMIASIIKKLVNNNCAQMFCSSLCLICR